jgi:KaiC/GvpD/RAD55 family RecA-like ATPase
VSDDGTLDLEAALLGGCLVHREGVGVARQAGLTPGHFRGEDHGLLFAACLDLDGRGAQVDALLVADVLRRDGAFTDELSLYLGDLIDRAVPRPMLPAYAARLVEHRAGNVSQDADHQQAQIVDTERYLQLDGKQFLRWPWRELDRQLGGLAPADIAFIVGHSGGGKTSFMLSLVHRLLASGVRIYYAGLESRPKWLRAQLACRVLGIDPGPVFAGDAQRWHNWPTVRDQLAEEVRGQITHPLYKNLRFSPHEFIGAAHLESIGNAAAAFHADLLIIDHVDHIDPEGSEASTFQESRRINLGIKRLADRTGVRVMATTQTNWTGLAADPWRNHRPTREENVYMGGHKKQIAAAMVGLFRPMQPGLKKDDFEAVREGRVNKVQLLEKGVQAVHVMKSRNYGANEGNVVRLGFDRGEVVDHQPIEAVA